MCGINGITKNDRGLIERMDAVISHRGPDGTGIYTADGISLGHNRLAIIDLSPRGAQPMKSADSSLVITYNGELYNYRELKAELKGYSFTSDSDTEVVLAAYERWGVDCLKRLNGIFAFGLWNARTCELILARDPLGVKPLYYAWKDGVLLFSSEAKALFEAGVARTLDRQSFSNYLRTTDVPGPGSMVEEVKKLLPGHYARVKDGHMEVVRFWSTTGIATETAPDATWHTRIQNTLDAAVTRQLIADRPVGVFLSGGIDSSAVLASVIRAQGPVRTYTTRFEVGSVFENEKFNRDADLAKRTAAHFGTPHTEVVVRSDEVIPLFEEAVWHLDEPSGSATALSQLAIARRASKDVAVVLGGDGGDELFGGYERYRLSNFMDLYQTLPKSIRHALDSFDRLGKLDVPGGVDRYALFHFTKQRELDQVVKEPFASDMTTAFIREAFFSGSDAASLATLMAADRSALAEGSLLRTDKLSMASGLEARVPLLDRELVELSARIPAERKVSLFTTKKLFKDAVRDRLPNYLFNEPKRGWSAPAGMWLMQSDFHAYAKEVLSPSYYAPTKELFDWNALAGLLTKHYEGTKGNRVLLWSLLSFQVWARRFQVVV